MCLEKHTNPPNQKPKTKPKTKTKRKEQKTKSKTGNKRQKSKHATIEHTNKQYLYKQTQIPKPKNQ